MATKISYFNIPVDGAIDTVSIHDAGSGYAVADEVTIDAGNVDGVAVITSVDGSGGVTGIGTKPSYRGTGYTTASDLDTVYGGTGTGLTVDITAWDSSGNITVSEVGFAPVAIFFIGTHLDYNAGVLSNCNHFRGAYTANGSFAKCIRGTNKEGEWGFSKTELYCVYLRNSSDGVIASGTVTGTNADGWTMNFDVMPTATYPMVTYVAWSSDTVKYADISEQSIPVYTSATPNLTLNIGQNADMGLYVTSGGTSAGELYDQGQPAFTTGVFTTIGDAGNRGVAQGNISSSWGLASHGRGLQATAIARINRATAVNAAYSVTGFPKDSLRILNTSQTSVQYYFHLLQLSGIYSRMVQITTPTGGEQDVSYTSLGFQAEGLIFLTRQSTGAPGITAISGWCHGFSDGTFNICFTITSRRFTVFGQIFDIAEQFNMPGYAFYNYVSGGSVVSSAWCTGITSTGFNLHYDVASSACPALVIGWKQKPIAGTKTGTLGHT